MLARGNTKTDIKEKLVSSGRCVFKFGNDDAAHIAHSRWKSAGLHLEKQFAVMATRHQQVNDGWEVLNTLFDLFTNNQFSAT